MSALDNMRGPRLETPLLFLLLLLSSLTGTAWGDADVTDDAEQEEAEPENTEPLEEVHSTDTQTAEETDPPETGEVVSPSTALDPLETGADENTSPPSASDPSATPYHPETDGSGLEEAALKIIGPTGQTAEIESPEVILILIPAVLAVVIIGAIVAFVIIMRRRKDKAQNQEPSKEDLDLEGSSTEKVPMPMFEDDVPSVLELEMEELDQLMQKDG